jgi:hypothetical protein
MALYLCKMDPTGSGEPRFVLVVGRIVEVRTPARGAGYRFIPHTAGRKTSRKIWPSANACIPKWTDKLGFLQLLDAMELEVAQRRARLSA